MNKINLSLITRIQTARQNDKVLDSIVNVFVPAKGEQRSAEQNKWHIMRTVARCARGALTNHERSDERRKSGSDVDWRAARKIEGAQIPKPPATQSSLAVAARCATDQKRDHIE